ncbi:MATE family efflux transporter [Pelosinus sp. sgz500959]|uniref:MATE family efflux transporter n=1 Tax=Pelosinus sp. sgz500959 TaxID=3242472 RepID=UPI00366C2BFF
MDNSKLLGEEKIGKLLWKFSVPAIVGMLVNALYNVVDSIFVGNGVGEIALAAVAIAFPIMVILMAFGVLIGVGASSLISIRLGQQRIDEAEKILGNAYMLASIVMTALSMLMLIFLDPLLISLGAGIDLLPYARDFMSIILLGSVFMHIGFGMNTIIRAQGDPKTAMLTMFISAGINIVLNPLFIFAFKMGISGSAWATVLAQAVSAIWVTLYFIGKKSFLKLRIANLYPDRYIILQIMKNGLSPFLMQFASSIVAVLFNFSLLKYGGEVAIASMGIIQRVAMLLVMPMFGISQGLQPIIGFNYGAKKYDRVIKVLKLGIISATVLSIMGFIVIQVFDTKIISVFNQDPALIAVGKQGIKIVLAMLPILGFQLISAQYFQAVGKAKHAIFLSMSRQVILLIPLLLIMPNLFGLMGAWIATPLADLGAAVVTAVFLLKELRRMNSAINKNPL